MEQWLDETDILQTLGLEKITATQLYEALEQLQEVDFCKIEESLAARLSKHEGKRSLVIDVTDTYFEGESLDEAPRRGKDGKVRKLVQIALAVTEKWGFPIFHRTFEGNINGKRMFMEMLASLARLGYEGMILDRGFWSAANIEGALALNQKVICGVVKDRHFKAVLSGVDKAKLYARENRVALENTKVYVMSTDYKTGKLLVIYNPYIDVARRESLYDRGGEEGDAAFLGYSLIFHNTDLGVGEVVGKYFDKDVVERSFKQLKGILSLRPVRVWLRSHVEAHIKICYVAYAILSLLQFEVAGLDISAVEALEVIRPGYRVKLKDVASGFEWEAFVELKKVQERIRNVVYKNG